MNKERLMQVLVSPLVSEKSHRLADSSRQYAFKVLPDASKPEIRAAVELLFDVKVDRVRVVNTKGKTRRFQRYIGRQSDMRKAYVQLVEGQEINFGTGA
jgi:large subunit ribosomal protein L23